MPEIEPRIVVGNLIAHFVAPLLAIVLPFLTIIDAVRPIVGKILTAILPVLHTGAVFQPRAICDCGAIFEAWAVFQSWAFGQTGTISGESRQLGRPFTREKIGCSVARITG